MAPHSPERDDRRPIGVRGPFDAYPTRDSMLDMVDQFLYRTGLLDYAHYIRIGAFLARRPFGEKQVQYLKRAREEEDKPPENGASGSWKDLSDAPKDVRNASNDTNEPKKLRRQYEYDKLNREGDRGRWQIFWRQSWRVHALVLCCSLGAAIQGWDESAVNGGNLDLPQLRSSLTCGSAQLYYPTVFNIADRPALIGLINSAPYLMCILSCS